MVGPSGCGKTEVARRLATLTQAPFIKVEATKYTEIGFHGKDVDLIIHDLARVAVRHAKSSIIEELERRKIEIESLINHYIVTCLLGPRFSDQKVFIDRLQTVTSGHLDERQIDLELPPQYLDESEIESIDHMFRLLKEYVPGTNPNASQQQDRVTIKEAKRVISETFEDKALNDINFEKQALKRAEEEGIVFIDEIDKIAVPEGMSNQSKSPSSDGVQRDLLPLIEGTIVQTKYGDIRTDHILFIASGAFHQAKVSDLIPELLGRLPVRVELKALSAQEFERVLSEPKYNLLEQQKQLLQSEGVQIEFTQCSITEIANTAFDMNMLLENIGARRLFGIVEKIMEDISFLAPSLRGQTKVIDATYVKERLSKLKSNIDLAKFLI